MIASWRLFYPIRERLRIGIATSLAMGALAPRRHPGALAAKRRAAGLLDGDIPSGYDGPIGRNTDT
jgi:hypothetical protein